MDLETLEEASPRAVVDPAWGSQYGPCLGNSVVDPAWDSFSLICCQTLGKSPSLFVSVYFFFSASSAIFPGGSDGKESA